MSLSCGSPLRPGGQPRRLCALHPRERRTDTSWPDPTGCRCWRERMPTAPGGAMPSPDGHLSGRRTSLHPHRSGAVAAAEYEVVRVSKTGRCRCRCPDVVVVAEEERERWRELLMPGWPYSLTGPQNKPPARAAAAWRSPGSSSLRGVATFLSFPFSTSIPPSAQRPVLLFLDCWSWTCCNPCCHPFACRTPSQGRFSPALCPAAEQVA